MKVLITGSRGFIGANLCIRLRETDDFEVREFHRYTDPRALPDLVAESDTIIHLAGANRPREMVDFQRINVDLTDALCDAVRSCGGGKQLLLASSEQAGNGTPYGESKLKAEQSCRAVATLRNMSVAICRYPNVFGKWSRPDYNSAIATFSYRAARGEPLEIHDPAKTLTLVFVDDVVEQMLAFIRSGVVEDVERVGPLYHATVGEVADLIQRFAADRTAGRVAEVGTGLARALYATFISFLPSDRFRYPLQPHQDTRGAFVEFLKTATCGQFSYFTAAVGVTRGSHYHHTKTEKFVVVRGQARFGFRHLITGERLDLLVDGSQPQVVETIPGWVHDITNVGDQELIVLLWANEIFDPARPDTRAGAVNG